MVLDSVPKNFADEIKKQNLVRLFDQGGQPIAWDNLPQSLDALNSHNDPYRTLAWMVRKADSNGFNSKDTPEFKPGFCRAYMTNGTDFAEFAWADAMREYGKTEAGKKLAVSAVTAATAPALWNENEKKKDRLATQVPVLGAALEFAKSDAAKNLPGYRGDKKYEGKDECPPDPT
jgi:hypothetical protein